MPRMTRREVMVPISSPKNSWPIILTPMKQRRMPRPYLRSQNMSVTLLRREKRERRPMMAKMLEK